MRRDSAQESYSLGIGFLFLSLLAMVSPTRGLGLLLFALAIYFFIHGRHASPSPSSWAVLKAVQSLTLAGLGLILLAALPAAWLGIGFLITLFGLIQFFALRGLYLAGALPRGRKRARK